MQRYVAMNLLVDAVDENENYFEEGHPQIHAYLLSKLLRSRTFCNRNYSGLLQTEAS